MKTFKIGGIHPKDHKLAAEDPSEILPIPKEVILMVNQHLGAPSQVLVQKGDKIKVGQVLTSNDAFLGSVVHASVSGTVKKIGEYVDASAYYKPAIFIDVEGDEWMENIDRSIELNKQIVAEPIQIIEKVKEMGIVGLGGACFPTHVKLNIPKGEHAEFLLVNGVECEPYLTDDYRLMMEKSEEILVGIQILKKALGVNVAKVGIEKNKPLAIARLTQLSTQYEGIEIVPLQMKYPQGAEKQLIKALTGREVPSGQLPIRVGCVVDNVATCFAVYEAVQKNKPLIERLVTLTGPSLARAKNYWARIGTPIPFLIEAAGGMPESIGKILAGGPMMGKALYSEDFSVSKGTSAILLVPEGKAHRREVSNCFHCGRCVEACPMGLEPYLISAATEHAFYDRVEAAKVMDCIECGCCQYSCPANRYLLDALRMGKNKVGQIIRARK
ncbi:MAG: electron transport complex subunit RsxC [Bacteroidales bacterium]